MSVKCFSIGPLWPASCSLNWDNRRSWLLNKCRKFLGHRIENCHPLYQPPPPSKGSKREATSWSEPKQSSTPRKATYSINQSEKWLRTTRLWAQNRRNGSRIAIQISRSAIWLAAWRIWTVAWQLESIGSSEALKLIPAGLRASSRQTYIKW